MGCVAPEVARVERLRLNTVNLKPAIPGAGAASRLAGLKARIELSFSLPETPKCINPALAGFFHSSGISFVGYLREPPHSGFAQ